MKSIPLLMVMLLASNIGTAKDLDRPFVVEATNYSDGVLLLSEDEDVGLQVSISGPDGAVTSKSFAAFDPAFIFVNDTKGQPMADGLYSYEVWPIPPVTYTREESSVMPDRNELKLNKGSQVSPVNGSFRVQRGMIIDSGVLEEYADSKGAVE